MGDRDARMAAAAEALESGLQLVGATAVEDRLQEGAPAAIASMMAAGLRVRRLATPAPTSPRPPRQVRRLLLTHRHAVRSRQVCAPAVDTWRPPNQSS